MKRYRLIAIASLFLLSTVMILKSHSALKDIEYVPLRERLSISEGNTVNFEFTPRMSEFHEVAVECSTSNQPSQMEHSFTEQLEVSAEVLNNGSPIAECVWPPEDGLSFRAGPSQCSAVIGEFMATSCNRYVIALHCKRLGTSLAASQPYLVVYVDPSSIKEREFRMAIMLLVGWSIGGTTVLVTALIAINHLRPRSAKAIKLPDEPKR